MADREAWLAQWQRQWQWPLANPGKLRGVNHAQASLVVV
jgi:hypothetical protein